MTSVERGLALGNVDRILDGILGAVRSPGLPTALRDAWDQVYEKMAVSGLTAATRRACSALIPRTRLSVHAADIVAMDVDPELLPRVLSPHIDVLVTHVAASMRALAVSDGPTLRAASDILSNGINAVSLATSGQGPSNSESYVLVSILDALTSWHALCTAQSPANRSWADVLQSATTVTHSLLSLSC